MLLFVLLSTVLAQELIDGQYIVVFHLDTTNVAREAHYGALKLSTNETILHKYDFPGFSGYAARMNKDTLGTVRAAPAVKYVEQDGMVHATECDHQTDAPWGLARTSSEEPPPPLTYKYDSSGANVDVYVIDTGIRISHRDFEGRAVWGANFIDGGADTDGNGHGTHVASTVAGALFGIAKKATVIAVKTLSRQGSGARSGTIAGVNWVANQHGAKRNGRPSVANMSLGGVFGQPLNDAVDSAVRIGVSFAVAAGNSNANACNTSPSSAELAVCVGSTTITDARSSFSNIGTCVDIFAPGSNIDGAWINSDTDSRTISGTSMACPHVAGAMARILGDHPDYTPAQVTTSLLDTALENRISNEGPGSPNLLLHMACE